MAEIQGLGACAICFKDIQDPKTGVPSAIRHWKGHQLAHKDCFEKQKSYEETEEYKIDQAKSDVENAERRLDAARYELDVARIKLKRLLPPAE